MTDSSGAMKYANLAYFAKSALVLAHSNTHVLNRVKIVTASHAFRVDAPTIWNHLPDYVKAADSFDVCKRSSKCYLLDAAFE
jgi:hypothetical protein